MIDDYVLELHRRNLAAGTIYKRRRCVELFAGWLHPRPLDDASTLDVQVFLDSRQVTARTRYDWISHLHCFYRWAVDTGALDRDPTARIVRPRTDRLLPRPILDADLAYAVSQAPQIMRVWLLLGAYAGLRVSEIAGLRRGDVLEADAQLRVLGKGRRERFVPMHPEVLAALRGYGMPRSGSVFVRPCGTPYPPSMVSREISLYLTSVGVDATAHQLRHWFGTKTYRSCRDLRTVQELLGHASPTTTAGYAAASPENARHAVAALTITP